MQAGTSPARKLDSSPPPAPLQEGDGTVHSAERSPTWNTPSSTRTLAHFSSPELPSLPSLPKLRSVLRDPPAPSTQVAADDNFYTASWGSPYTPGRAPPINRERLGGESSGNIDNESPDPRFGLGHLLPTRLGLLQELSPTRPPTPASDLSSDHSAPTPLGPVALSRSALGRQLARESPLRSRAVRSHHQSDSALTVKQEDFNPKPDGLDRVSAMYQSRYASTPPAAAEKKLPELPKESPSEDLPTPGLFDLASPPMPKMQRNQSTASVTSPTRPKKKVQYKGKNCLIGLPLDPPRGGNGNAPVPLTKEEIAARLDRFSKLGYDVRGFDHWRGLDESLNAEHKAQARAIYPDSAEEREARKRKSYRVRLPDTREWDEKENSKVEAMLRELGVSGPDGEGEVENPMSRQASSHISSNPFSPPVRSASANSQPLPHGGSFPPGFAPISAPTSHPASTTSPLSSMANVRPTAHLHRQSTFSPPLPQQMPPPGLGGWSPQPFAQALALSSGGSPSLASTRPEVLNRQSPVIPVQAQPAQQFSFAQRDELIAQMHRQQQLQLQMQLQKQQEQQILASRSPSTLHREAEGNSKTPTIQTQPTLVRSGDAPEVVHPKPVHRHNISAQLEQDAENGRYLDDSVRRLVDEDDVDEQSRADAVPQRISSLQKQVEGSDVETNPSDLDNVQRYSNANGFGKAAPFKFSRSWTDDSAFSPILPQGAGDSHAAAAEPSTTSLNVTAKEFNPGSSNFNPGSSTFNPGSFTGSSFSFQPQAKAKPFIPKTFSETGHSTQSSVASPGSSSFNPAAAAFSPVGLGGFSFSSAPKDFSFNSQGPTFNPSAPVFSPNSPFSDNSIGSSTNSNSIFGSINIPNVVKPTKKSKAVPIVPPKQPSPLQDDKEDEDGRPIQDDAHFKRPRRRDSDGDQVPRFAGPYAEETAPLEPTRKDTLTTQIDDSVASDDAEEITQDISLLTHSTLSERREEDGELDYGSPRHVPVHRKSIEDAEEAPAESDREAELSAASDRVVSQKSSPGKRKAHQRSLSALAPVFKPRLQPEIDPDLNPYYGGSPDIQDSHTPEPIVSPASSRRSSHTDVERYQEPPREDEVEISEPPQRVPSSVRYYDEQDEAGYVPTFEEIDTVMRHMDEEGSDAGVEREVPSWPASSPSGPATLTPGRIVDYQRELQAKLRSDAPSPSPRRLYAPPAPLEGESDPFSDARAAASPPPVEDDAEEPHPERIISDWDDAVSEGHTEQFEDRSRFFDRRVSTLIDKAVATRLDPLEQQLQAIHSSLSKLDRSSSRRRPRSQPAVDSDADDEDDDAAMDAIARGWSPRRNGRYDKFRAIVQEALAAQQQSGLDDLTDALAGIKTTLTAVSSLNADDLRDAVTHIKASVDDSVSQVLRLDDIQAIVEETVARQNSALIEQREQATRHEESNRFAEFSDALRQAAVRLTEETEARKLADKRREDAERLLKLTEEELSMFKESSRDVGQAATHIADQVHKATVRADDAEAKAAEAEAEAKQLRSEFSKVSTENAALMATIEEYRLSHDKWRRDIDKAYQDREAVMQTFTALRLQAEESIRLRETMRTRMEKLNADVSDTAAQVASERAQWQRKEADYLARVEVISARAEAEARTRERFEREMERLEVQEREAMRLRSTLEQAKKDNAYLEDAVTALRLEAAEHQKTADQYAREFREAREAGHIEVERTRRLLEADIEAANNQVNIARAELEAEVARVRNELDHVKMDADTAKARHELELEQAADARRDALQEAHQSKHEALEEQKYVFEERLEELRKRHRRDLDDAIENKNQAETFLKETHAQKMQGILEQHRREMEQIVEGKMQTEKLLNDRLVLSEERVDYLQDKVLHLEEKLEVAKAAAHAAALAARSGKAPALETPLPAVVSRGPERLNAQALRETIAVLQDQLQERESRIETLEQEISELDKDAPHKLKAKDTEIGWLRELLGVRIDDLGDLVNALAHPDFDREAVRNAAIRIKSGLQMEQHDKERQMSGSPQFPTLASISNFASPRAAQLAAAWGNWRKGRELIPSSLSQSVQSLAGGSESRDMTPSKPGPSAQNLLTGLMTPPASNLRPSPEPESVPKTANGSIGRSTGRDLHLSSRAQEKMPLVEAPATPNLLHKASYDSDAVVDDGDYSTAGYYDDDESTVDGTPRGIRRGSSLSGSVHSPTTPRGQPGRRQSSFGGSAHSSSPRAHRRGSFGPSMI